MATLLHADFNQRVFIRPDNYQCVASAMPKVERMTLDRVGDEVIVHYKPFKA